MRWGLIAVVIPVLLVLLGSHTAVAQPTRRIAFREINAAAWKDLVQDQPGDIRLRAARVLVPVEVRDVSSAHFSDVELAGLRMVGVVNGSVIVERAVIRGEFKLLGVRVRGDLVFRDCVFECGFLINEAKVAGDVLIEGCASEEFRSEIQNLEGRSLRIERFRNTQWQSSDGVMNDLDYRTLLMQGIDLEQDVVVRDVVTSVMSISGSVGRDLLIGGAVAGRVRLENLAVRDRSTLWPEPPLQQLEVVRCDLGEALRLRLSSSAASPPRVIFGGGISGFRELPAASLLIPALDFEGNEKDRVAMLTSLMRAYEAIGNTSDTRYVEGVVAGLQVRRSTGIEAIEHGLRWLSSGPTRTPRLILIWLALGAGGFVLLWLGQRVGVIRIHVAPDVRKAVEPRNLGDFTLAAKVALDGMMPVPVEHGLILVGASFFVHATMRLLVWLLLLLFVQSLA